MTKPKSSPTSSISDSEWKYPQKKPNKSGHLQVDNGPPHRIYWAEYGNPRGEPVLFVHGGPGGACGPELSRFFDPKRYRIILFHQRGCGKSTPTIASDGAQVALKHNTTGDLVEDIVKLRRALDITGKMHVFGTSWGSTLSMAYAIKHPDTVQDLILSGIFLGRKEDLDYLYQGNAATYAKDPNKATKPGAYITFPEPWKQYVETIAPEKRGDMIKAYKEIFDMKPKTDADRALQRKAAAAYWVWEGLIGSLAPNMKDMATLAKDDFAIGFSQFGTHYFANKLFLPKNYILNHVADFAHIPTHIIHGRYDQVCAPTQAESLVAAFRKAGAEPARYIKTIAGHNGKDRENFLALSEVMEHLPSMKGFHHAKKAAQSGPR